MSLQSMTGFGRTEATVGASRLTIEVKSVNHRYLDSRFRMPGFLAPLEIELTELLRTHFTRGSFDVSIRHKLIATGESGLSGTKYVVDAQAAQSLMECYQWLHETYGTEKAPSAEVFTLSNRVIVPVEENADLKETGSQVKKAFLVALEDLKKMRGVEGKKLKEILEAEMGQLAGIVKKLDKVAPLQPEQIATKLKKRLERWELSPSLDTERIEQEIALYAEKSDFTEELDRLKTHQSSFNQLLGEKNPVGRKLDFMTQELHREFNTLSSKAAAIEITQLALSGKACIEKLRQQVQNVE